MQQITLPPLSEGETYIGAIGDQTGSVYHLILLAGDNDPAPQQAQMDWAKSISGDLPNKLEAAMLFAHAKDQFQTTWYWTNQTFIDPDNEEDDSWAWLQLFNYGTQFGYRKSYQDHARAVRRLPI